MSAQNLPPRLLRDAAISAGAAPQPGAPAAMPAALSQFRLLRHDELAPAQADVLLARLRVIPRPPRAMHQLISPQFLTQASSAELSDLMMGEPQIAAKVLSVVNSPLYGLTRPMASIGQAATLLGMNTVRGICLQHMLDDSFQTSSPQTRRMFDRLWNASSLSSELCFKLAQLLHMPEPGALVTQVVLSYLGPLAACSLMPPQALASAASQGLLDRASNEQAVLGLSGSEIGGLLMREWALPDTIVDDVGGIDRVLVTPWQATDAQRGARLALCYLCARLGDKLAAGDITDLAAFDLATQSGPDFYHLHTYLAQPGMARVSDFLRFPEVVTSMNQMLVTMSIRP